MTLNLDEKINFLKKINSDDYNYEKMKNEQITVSFNNSTNKMTINMVEYINEIIMELDNFQNNENNKNLIELLKHFMDKYMDDISKEFNETSGCNGNFMLENLACDDDLFLHFLNKFGLILNDIIGLYICECDFECVIIIMEYLVKYNIKINKNSIEKHINLIKEYIKEDYFDISTDEIGNYLKECYDIEL